MSSMTSPKKRSPSSKARKQIPQGEAIGNRLQKRPALAKRRSLKAAVAWWESLPTDSEMDRVTGLVPLWVAESILQEAGNCLRESLPAEWAAALAEKAERCFAGHRQFRRLVSSNANHGNAGRANLRRFMRHWLAGILMKKRPALYRRLPWNYALGAAPVVP